MTRIPDHAEFCRLVVHGPEDLLIDLALDAAPQQAGTASFVGPTFAPEELAARKLLALFDRTEARDFADVYVLAQRYGKHVLLQHATALDQGLDPKVLAQFMSTLTRDDDADMPVAQDHLASLRKFFAMWQAELDPYPADDATPTSANERWRGPSTARGTRREGRSSVGGHEPAGAGHSVMVDHGAPGVGAGRAAARHRPRGHGT